MRRIKTVVFPIEKADAFDSKVNALLADGWTLEKREITTLCGEPSEAFSVPVVRALYAELSKQSPPWPEESTE